jgi:hypothetical protein
MSRLRFFPAEGLQWLRFAYFVITLIAGVQTIFKSSLAIGAGAIGAAALCYFSVATFVGSYSTRREQSYSTKDLAGIGVVAVVLCGVGCALMLWTGWRITIDDVAIPGFAWALVGIMTAAITTTRKDALPSPGVSTANEFEAIIHAYSTALTSAAGRLVMDSSELPHPKERIKGALAFALRHTSDASMKSQLRAAYLSLADWQPGIGDVGEAVTRAVTEANLTDDVRLGAARIVRAGAPFQRWLPIIEAERKQLVTELERLDQLR